MADLEAFDHDSMARGDVEDAEGGGAARHAALHGQLTRSGAADRDALIDDKLGGGQGDGLAI